jgi:hypothetical protein
VEKATLHILKQLKLPDRYEALAALVGADVAKVLVSPEREVVTAFETAANSIRSRREGLFVPLVGTSGIGKTTFATSLSHFFPQDFAPTVSHTGPVEYDALNQAVADAEKLLAANDQRLIPVNLDHRESAPPTAAEMAAIKRFLRAPSRGARSVVLWPETSREVAEQIADNYRVIAGAVPINLPVPASGPPRSAWAQVAVHTLELANHVESLIDLGIDPSSYQPERFATIGDYLREISNDFSRRLTELVQATRRPVSLTIVFASASGDAGVLSELTAHGRYGLLDGHALVDATRESEVGRWWQDRRGLLTQAILRLNAHAFCLPPTPAISILRNFGDPVLQEQLAKMSVARRGAKRVAVDLARTDFGKYLRGESRAALEARGTPAVASTKAFTALAQQGFSLGQDKSLNRSAAEAIAAFMKESDLPFESVVAETKLDFCPLMPDNAVFFPDNVLCIEYTWRKGEFLLPRTRSAVAQYVLEKLRNYARELGWVGAA